MEQNENKPVTMQIRADEQTREQFAELCKALGVTQGAAMQQLLHVYEMDTARSTMQGSADVIDDVRSHMDAVVNAFLVQLERNINTDSRVRADYDAQLQTLTTALQQAQQRAAQAQETAVLVQQALDEVKAASEQEQQQAIAQVADANDRADRAEQAWKVAEQAVSDARRTADALSAQLNSITAERDKLRFVADRADDLAGQLTVAQAEINRLATAAQVAEAKAETSQAKAVADARQEMQDKLDAVRNAMQSKLDTLRDKLDATRTELATVKDELHQTQADRDELTRKVSQQSQPT